MTVGEMRDRMGADEFTRWGIYYARQAQREELAHLRTQATKGRAVT